MNLLSPKLLSMYSCGLLLAAPLSLAQAGDDRFLILKTQPEDTVIELIGSVDVRGDGNIEATPADPVACSGTGGGPVDCGDVEVGAPTFRVNGSTTATVTAGATLSFSWNSRGAWDCQAGGDLPGWDHQNLQPRSTDDSRRNFSTTGLANGSPYTASLICSNGPVQSNGGVEQTVSVTVNSGDPAPEGCEGREPPSGWTRLSTGVFSCIYSSGWVNGKDCRTWNPGVWSSDPAGSAGQTQRLVTNRSGATQYIAMAFSTNDLGANEIRRITTEQGGDPLKDVRRIMTISSCPGDFNQQEIMAETGCYGLVNALSPFRYGGVNTSLGCKLESGRTYFLNIIATQSPLGTPTQDIQPHADCGIGSLCGSVYTPRNF